MIKIGKKTNAKYWGEFTVEDVVELQDSVKCYSKVKGDVEFKPTIVKIKWKNDPSDDKHDLWFPYWMVIDGKEKYGQYAPMIGQKAFLELIKKAIERRYFNDSFLTELKINIEKHFDNLSK
jgi:hypothetical protein